MLLLLYIWLSDIIIAGLNGIFLVIKALSIFFPRKKDNYKRKSIKFGHRKKITFFKIVKNFYEFSSFTPNVTSNL